MCHITQKNTHIDRYIITIVITTLAIDWSLNNSSIFPNSIGDIKRTVRHHQAPASPDEQPCDLRLLTPATCLREYSGGLHQSTVPPPAVSIAAVSTPLTPNTPATGSSAATPFSAMSTVFKVENMSVASGLSMLPTPVTGGAFSCERCGNSYARPHSLNRHKRFECGVEPKFECPICHKKSKHKHNLVLHMRTHQQRWSSCE